MTEQNIPNEAAFLHALGVDPNKVKAGSTTIQWNGPNPVLIFTMMQEASPAVLGHALIASAQPPAPERSPEHDHEHDGSEGETLEQHDTNAEEEGDGSD